MRPCKHRRCDNLDLRSYHNCCCCKMGGSAWTCCVCGRSECRCCGETTYRPDAAMRGSVLSYCPTPDKPNHTQEGMYCAAR